MTTTIKPSPTADATPILPQNLVNLHAAEELLRDKARGFIMKDERLKLHIAVVESAMDLIDVFRQFDTNDEDLKVIQVLGMRTFNAFGAALKLSLSGYHQHSVLILRDVLETTFLIDYFSSNHTQIERWRFADKKTRLKEFSPVKIREALDARDGFTEKKRYAMYELFSELACHPTMKSISMMRPKKDGDAVSGPFMESTALEAGISEMGRLAIQTGEQIGRFFPDNQHHGMNSRIAFAKLKQRWINIFYPTLGKPKKATASSKPDTVAT